MQHGHLQWLSNCALRNRIERCVRQRQSVFHSLPLPLLLCCWPTNQLNSPATPPPPPYPTHYPTDCPLCLPQLGTVKSAKVRSRSWRGQLVCQQQPAAFVVVCLVAVVVVALANVCIFFRPQLFQTFLAHRVSECVAFKAILCKSILSVFGPRSSVLSLLLFPSRGQKWSLSIF